MLADATMPEGLGWLKEQRLRAAMTTQEGIEVIARVLAQWRGSQILISTRDIKRVSVQIVNADRPPILAPELEPAGVENVDLAIILDIWKGLLALETIQPSDKLLYARRSFPYRHDDDGADPRSFWRNSQAAGAFREPHAPGAP